jgi:hypothetical protein
VRYILAQASACSAALCRTAPRSGGQNQLESAISYRCDDDMESWSAGQPRRLSELFPFWGDCLPWQPSFANVM